MKYNKIFEDFFDDIDDTQQDITGEFNSGSGDTTPNGEFLMYAEVRQFDYWSSGYSGNKYYNRKKGARLGYKENETLINLYEMLRIFKLVANNCRFMSDAVVTVKMKVEDWDDKPYFEEDITNGISQNKKYGVNFFDMEDWCFKRHKDADDMSMYLSAEYTFGITFNADLIGMKKLSDEMKKIIMIFRNYTFKKKTQYGLDINKKYIETVIIQSSDAKKTASDGSHGFYIQIDSNRCFSDFNELGDLYKYLYNKSPLEQRNELLNNILKKNHIEKTISDIVEKFRYGVKKYGAALRIFKYRFEKSLKSSKNENYYDTCHVLFIDVMFDKDADSENMTCEDVLYDLSENCVNDKRLVNISRYVNICFRFWNENMNHKIKTANARVYDARYGFQALSYDGTGAYGGSKSVPLRNFFVYRNRLSDVDYAQIYAAFPDKGGKLSNTQMKTFTYSDMWKNVFNVRFFSSDEIFGNKPYFDESEVKIIENDKIFII